MTPPTPPRPTFFRSSSAFGAWLARHHVTARELWVGLYKKHAAHRGMTYPEAVEEALCWGWIDGQLRRVDEDRVMQRYTPRRAKSTWSLVNVAKVKILAKAGRMRAPGLAAFKARDPDRTGIYSFEQATVALSPGQRRLFKRSAMGWAWFSAQGASYRRTAIHWVVSAKKEETRVRRLQSLISHSAAGKKLRQFTPLDQRKK